MLFGRLAIFVATAVLAPANRVRVGEHTVCGDRVAALLELGSGFHGDLTGRENVFLNASLLGLSRQKTRDQYEEIVEFSGVREFINEPLRTYSS
jgi:ABC-type polysaccharide/polyol phosphate transport system ATPase subunit